MCQIFQIQQIAKFGVENISPAHSKIQLTYRANNKSFHAKAQRDAELAKKDGAFSGV